MGFPHDRVDTALALGQADNTNTVEALVGAAATLLIDWSTDSNSASNSASGAAASRQQQAKPPQRAKKKQQRAKKKQRRAEAASNSADVAASYQPSDEPLLQRRAEATSNFASGAAASHQTQRRAKADSNSASGVAASHQQAKKQQTKNARVERGPVPFQDNESGLERGGNRGLRPVKLNAVAQFNLDTRKAQQKVAERVGRLAVLGEFLTGKDDLRFVRLTQQQSQNHLSSVARIPAIKSAQANQQQLRLEVTAYCNCHRGSLSDETLNTVIDFYVLRLSTNAADTRRSQPISLPISGFAPRATWVPARSV
eukprot:COSAG03_NODE_2010_length_3221_cov_333.794363_2_plen_312_part_00